MLLVKQLAFRYNPWTLTALQLIAGALFFSPGLYFWAIGPPIEWSPALVAAIGFLGGGGQSGGFRPIRLGHEPLAGFACIDIYQSRAGFCRIHRLDAVGRSAFTAAVRGRSDRGGWCLVQPVDHWQVLTGFTLSCSGPHSVNLPARQTDRLSSLIHLADQIRQAAVQSLGLEQRQHLRQWGVSRKAQLS